MPVLENPKIEHRRFAISELSLELMYLDHDWKLLLNRKGEAYRLFNVKKDPREMEDLIGRDQYEGLREQWEAEQKRGNHWTRYGVALAERFEERRRNELVEDWVPKDSPYWE